MAAGLDLLVRAWWFLDSLPQAVVWALVVTALLFLTLRLAGRVKWEREPRGRAEPASVPSELAEMVTLVRRAEFSSRARWQLGRRLSQAAVALRVRREAIPSRRAWDDLDEGRWPRKPELLAVLRGHGWRLPMPIAGYSRQLRTTVDSLWDYAKGGDLDGN